MRHNPERSGRILIASGASAGHLYPSLALAENLKRRQPPWEIAFVACRRSGIEKRIESLGYKVFNISIRPFSLTPRKFLVSLYSFVKSFLEAFLIIEKFRPDAVVGFGSYASFPVILESALFKKPTIIHEQNVSLGLSNKVLSLFADRIALGFSGARQSAGSAKFVFTGNPLRCELVKRGKEESRAFFGLDERFTVLVLGGSQGSERINTEFRKAAGIISAQGRDFQFIHLCGKKDYSGLKKDYSCIKIKYCLYDFLERMDFAYSLADLVVCRAGAGSITELAFFAKPAILIPYPHAGGHQSENAGILKERQAALVIEEKDLDSLKLAELIVMLMDSASERSGLASRIAGFACPRSSDRLAELVLNEVSS